MATYFDTMSQSFSDVPVTPEGIATTEFMEACESLIAMFTLFNSSAFSMVQSDLSNNVQKLRARFLATPNESRTIELLVVNEKTEKKRTATEGLLWLNRGLAFTHAGLLHSYENPDVELSVSFTKAYEQTLKKYHSFIVRPVFGLAMKACPTRESLFKQLGQPPERVNEELGKWLVGLGKLVKRIDAFYEAGGHGKGF